jgi:hypothetical protein
MNDEELKQAIEELNDTDRKQHNPCLDIDFGAVYEAYGKKETEQDIATLEKNIALMREERDIATLEKNIALMREEELRVCVKEFFEKYLNHAEESDGGKMFNPIVVSCSRAMMTEPLNNLLARMAELSGAAPKENIYD